MSGSHLTRTMIFQLAAASKWSLLVTEMKITPPEESPLFTRWQDPVSGVESLVLTQHRIAPHQQSFYFTNPSFTRDGRYLWLYCAFPPGGDAYYGRQLAVVDFENQTLQCFPETEFMDASPFVDKDTGEVYWTTCLEIWKRGPLPGDRASLVAAFPNELARNRRPLRLATHLTLSADKKSFAIDAQIGNEWFLGDLPVDGTTPFRLWQKFDRGYNHTQFSPTDPDLMLTAQDSWYDANSGAYGAVEDRLWLIRRGGKARPIYPHDPSNMRGHEWWDADGRHVWYIDYRKGTEKVNIETGEKTNVWPNGHTHSHTDQQSRYLVGDINPQPPYTWRVAFFNIRTGKEINIVTEFPPMPARNRYHTHPHPQFSCNDRYICYTTNVMGTTDMALVSVADLVARTS